jgi:formylglycine-generating enzyme required for sulfatase activity
LPVDGGQQNPSHYTALVAMLSPIRDTLIPPLSEAFRSRERGESERSWATNLLAEYAGDPERLGVLTDLLLDADEKQFAVLYPKFQERGEQGWRLLAGEIDKRLPPDLPSSDERREKLAKRQANAAVALLRMGRADKVWPLLKHSPDPRVQSYLIHRLYPLGTDAGAILQRLDEEPDITIRRALLLGLGEFGPDRLPAADREPLLAGVLRLYRDNPDAGLHGAAEWLLRQWDQDQKVREIDQAWAKDNKHREERLEHLERELRQGQGKAGLRWYVNGQGQTMVVIPGPVEFLMGSPPTEASREGGPEGKLEQLHKKRIGRSFAIAAREVTVEQVLRFRKGHNYSKEYSPTLGCPVNAVSWYDAAAYCNWLSKQEGIPENQWCYLPNDKGEYAEGMKLAPDYLGRTGYRLPSEAEWEYACRAGALTSRYYGETEELLGKYAWYMTNSKDRGMLPGLPGRLGVRGNCLKPNDFGLFDMLGNALELCQESVTYYTPGVEGKPREDREDKQDITDKRSRVLRGSSFNTRSRFVRCANRNWNVPTYRSSYVGYRPARTFR